MNQDEQKVLVHSLITAITEEIDNNFKVGKIPESWDGVELRWLLNKKFSEVVLHGIGSSYRKRDFNNHCLVNNI